MPTNYDDDARAFADALVRVMRQDDADAERARLAYGALKPRPVPPKKPSD